MLSKPSDLPGPNLGCGLQARSEGHTWSTVSPVLLWSRLPSSCCPHCQHPFLFLFLRIPQSYLCTGEKPGDTWHQPGPHLARTESLSVLPIVLQPRPMARWEPFPVGQQPGWNILGIWIRVDQRLLLIHLSSGAMVP